MVSAIVNVGSMRPFTEAIAEALEEAPARIRTLRSHASTCLKTPQSVRGQTQ